MNERIKELAGKALDQAVPQTWTALTAYDLNKFTEVFAELIVKECCSVADEVERADTGMFVSWYLKAHFGVEQ